MINMENEQLKFQYQIANKGYKYSIYKIDFGGVLYLIL